MSLHFSFSQTVKFFFIIYSSEDQGVERQPVMNRQMDRKLGAREMLEENWG